MMISRYQLAYAKERLFKGKALIIYGPRQAGKTTFAEMLLADIAQKILRLNGDEADVREMLGKPNITQLSQIIGDHRVLFLDEAQRIPEAGLVIKLITDHFKDVQVVATGSSAFELAGKVNEPLTGRKYEIILLPLSYRELKDHHGLLEEKRLLEQRLIYGTYPEVVNAPDNAEEHLRLLADSYLYKDLFMLEQVKKPRLLEKIVKALALQVGGEVNMSEIAQLVQADSKTVEKYIGLLEQSFVVFVLPAFSGNLRNEIKKGKKVYFYDNGIINAITGNFLPLRNRNDVGALWENHIISERKKRNIQQRIAVQGMYFWRTAQQQEIDFVEQMANGLLAAEIKWNPKQADRIPLTFRNAYPEALIETITPENRDEFIG
jgi:uncharacterized protein